MTPEDAEKSELQSKDGLDFCSWLLHDGVNGGTTELVDA
jgi:hypothetical protein